MIRKAPCCCGALEIACDAAPLKVSACHCRACQHRTGSAFGLAAFEKTRQSWVAIELADGAGA